MAGILRTSEAYVLAFHAMVYMAAHPSSVPVSVSWMAEKFQVSEAHLAKVLQRLAKLGLLSSKRGLKGGFVLARKPEDVTLLEVFEATEGPLEANACMLGRHVCQAGGCVMSELVHSVYDQVRDRLGKTRLSDLTDVPVTGMNKT